MALSALDEGLAELLDSLHEDDEEDDGFWHGAHLQCQWGAERVTLICGKTASWMENVPTPDHPNCKSCHPDQGWAICPLCGTRVKT